MSTVYSKFTGSSDHTDESIISASPLPPLRKIDEKPEIPPTFQAKDRKVSTGTLNRLILVAQALECEVDSRRQTDISGGKISFSIRMANVILLLLINILVFTGFGKYQAQQDGGYMDLMLTPDKWTFDTNAYEFPATFTLMQLNGQYLAAAITVFLLMSTSSIQLLHLCRNPSSRLSNMYYSFGAVPFSLFVFGIEMRYSTCPWVDEYYIQYAVSEMTAQCAINGWASWDFLASFLRTVCIGRSDHGVFPLFGEGQKRNNFMKTSNIRTIFTLLD